MYKCTIIALFATALNTNAKGPLPIPSLDLNASRGRLRDKLYICILTHTRTHTHTHTYIYIILNISEKNAIDCILDPPLLPHKRRLHFESEFEPMNEKKTKEPAAKRKRKLIQTSHVKVSYN